jgi:hypothetical protein
MYADTSYFRVLALNQKIKKKKLERGKKMFTSSSSSEWHKSGFHFFGRVFPPAGIEAVQAG